MPALATTAAFTFISTWNDFFSPLIYLTRSKFEVPPHPYALSQDRLRAVFNRGA